MVQNQAGAPAAPNTLNFQTDPASRASFKGFMTNLNALPNISTPPQAPAPVPMVPAADVDIFQPMPIQMQMGGAVPALQRLLQKLYLMLLQRKFLHVRFRNDYILSQREHLNQALAL